MPTKSGALERVCRQTQKLLDRGRVDAACDQRVALRRLCAGSSIDPLRARAQALCASLYLVRVEGDVAAAVLRPYLHRRKANFKAIDALAERSALAAAAIASTLADTLFRLREHRRALEAVSRAQALLESHLHEYSTDEELAHSRVLQVRTLARAARIHWCNENSGEAARKDLRDALETLEHVAHYIPLSQRYGLEAFIFDMWASWDWMSGRQAEARAKAYRALAVLRRPELADSARLAHAMLTVCRVESSAVTRTRYRFLIEDLVAAAKLFPVGHGLKALPLILKARIETKAGFHATALETLNAIHPTDLVQKAECSIARIWIHRRDRAWAAARVELKTLRRMNRRLPRRLQIEALVQEGAVVIESDDVRHFKSAVSVLEDARSLADNLKRPKLAIEPNFLLALAYKRLGRGDDAQDAMALAQAGLATTRSTYLEEYFAQRVAPEFERSLIFTVAGKPQYHQEVDRFRHEFVQYLVTLHGSVSAASAAAKVHETTLRDYLTPKSKAAIVKASTVPFVSPDQTSAPDS